MYKVIVLSLPRTGNQSIAKFLEDLGYSVLHSGGKEVFDMANKKNINIYDVDLDECIEVFMKTLDNYDSVCDSPYNVMYKDLFIKYKDCKFILIYRDYDSWQASIKKLYSNSRPNILHPMDRIQYWSYLESRPNYFNDISEDQLKNIYDLHINNIREYFKDNDNFFEINLNEIENGYKIAKFLDKADIFSQNNLSFKNIDNVIKNKNN